MWDLTLLYGHNEDHVKEGAKVVDEDRQVVGSGYGHNKTHYVHSRGVRTQRVDKEEMIFFLLHEDLDRNADLGDKHD